MGTIDKNCQSLIDSLHLRTKCYLCPDLDWKQTNEHKEYGITKTGHIKNIQIEWQERGYLYIRGSLPKLISGNNVNNISIGDVDRAIKYLEIVLNIDLQNSSIVRIDLASTLNVNSPVENYFDYLGECSRYVRSTIKRGSLYYESSNRVLSCYDKGIEIIAKRRIKATTNEKENLFRFEAKYYLKSIQRFIKRDFKIRDLYDEVIYQLLADIWLREYNSITKLNHYELDPAKILKFTDVRDDLIKAGLAYHGGSNNYFKMLERSPLFRSNSASEKSRNKKKLNSLGQTPPSIICGNLVNELTDLINAKAKTFQL